MPQAEAAHEIATQGGLLGAIFLLVVSALGIFTLRLYNKLNEVQAARVEDARAVTNTLVSATKEFSEALLDSAKTTRPTDQNILDALERVEQLLNTLTMRTRPR